jgi:hypothetical protein
MMIIGMSSSAARAMGTFLRVPKKIFDARVFEPKKNEDKVPHKIGIIPTFYATVCLN